ncbi:MAG: LVIVD repeat-containing protein [Thermoleophilaceae bacterium]
MLLLVPAPGFGHNSDSFMNVGPSDGGGAPIRASASAARARPVPRPRCRQGSRPETDIQGRVPLSAKRGFTCNLRVLGHEGLYGGYKVERYVDKHGHECAFYDGTLLFPGNAEGGRDEPTGTQVLDMSNPAHPKRTDTLQTIAMQSPHESLLLNPRRGLLAATAANPVTYPGVIDVYDVSQDCRHPALKSSSPTGFLGHESGFAPDGNTYYTSVLYDPGQVTAVDLRNPSQPTPVWTETWASHGLTISDNGNRAYLAARNVGLIILDVSEVQARKPLAKAHEISRLTWPEMTVPQVARPVTIHGRHYLVEVDEFSSNEGSNQLATNGSRVGAARIIDIQDERHPRVVSNIRLAVHQPENRARIANDPGNNSSLQGYAGHYCNVPRERDPEIVACSMIASGLRVFDIRDPYHPKELAYFAAPLHSNSSIVQPSNYAMSSPSFVRSRREIWYADGVQGFYAVRLFKGVWPSAGHRGCLARRSPIGPRNIGRVRLRYTRRQARRRIAPQPVRRRRYVYRWCVKRSKGRVTAVFSRRSPHGRIRLVASTARLHGMRGVHRGVRVRRLLRRFPHARRVTRGVYRLTRRSRRVFGTRRGRVRFVAVVDRRVLRSHRALRRYMRRAGL